MLSWVMSPYKDRYQKVGQEARKTGRISREEVYLYLVSSAHFKAGYSQAGKASTTRCVGRDGPISP